MLRVWKKLQNQSCGRVGASGRGGGAGGCPGNGPAASLSAPSWGGVAAVSPKGLSHKSTFSEIWIHLGNCLVIPGATVLKGASNSF